MLHDDGPETSGSDVSCERGSGMNRINGYPKSEMDEFVRYPIGLDGHVDVSAPATPEQIRSELVVGVSPDRTVICRFTDRALTVPAPWRNERELNTPLYRSAV